MTKGIVTILGKDSKGFVWVARILPVTPDSRRLLLREKLGPSWLKALWQLAKARGYHCDRSFLAHVIADRKKTKWARELIAEALELKVEDLWPNE